MGSQAPRIKASRVWKETRDSGNLCVITDTVWLHFIQPGCKTSAINIISVHVIKWHFHVVKVGFHVLMLFRRCSYLTFVINIVNSECGEVYNVDQPFLLYIVKRGRAKDFLDNYGLLYLFMKK